MTIGNVLYTVLLKPLQLIFEVIYNIAMTNINDPGLSIIALSLAINLLVLPLYKRADAMQEEQRETEAKLEKWVTHIKKTFRGDERTMMLQTYYRQNDYSPLYSLRGAASLLLEIPFFIAAYRFLSGLELLEGASFGPIADLSRPDALLRIGNVSVNVLPILMTAVNIISAAIFSKDYPRKTKIQLYAMAAVFLVLLYDSPSGLAFYWTLNNVFSLIKTVILKLKNSKLIVAVIAAFSAAPVFYWAKYVFFNISKRNAVLVVFLGALLLLPLLSMLLREKGKKLFSLPVKEPNTKNFILAALFLSVLTGLLIPSAVVSASPQEFMDVSYFVHPLWYPVRSFLLALGFFVLWFGVFYRLAAPKGKSLFECILWAFCIVAVVDYLFFATDLGTMSADLAFDSGFFYTGSQLIRNALPVFAVAAVTVLIYLKWDKLIPKVLTVALAALVCMSAVNCVQIRKSVNEIDEGTFEAGKASPQFTLSKTGKNVVVIMLDRALGEYVPYMFHEKPELKEQFSGFTYYSNVISFGPYTNFATPALYGGYEYTPAEMNRRDTELLRDKHDEALKVMPVLFSENGFDVTVFDPSYAGYRSIPDLSIYDGYEGIDSYITMGHFSSNLSREQQVENRYRNFFCYSLMKTAPLYFQEMLYDGGQYNQCKSSAVITGQKVVSPHLSYGIGVSFMKAYSVLQKLPEIMSVKADGADTFLMMSNDTTHSPILLQEPDYTPAITVDNRAYDEANTERFTVDGVTLRMETEDQYSHYEVNMAAMLQLGAWFDEMRNLGVYDNTRIILVSDHGRNVGQIDQFVRNEYNLIPDNLYDLEHFYPLLMVKDFGSTGFTVSDEFMTNADVPTLATAGLIENPVNPMTGKAIGNSEKTAHDQYIIASDLWNLDENYGTTYHPARWYSVHDNIWDMENWTMIGDGLLLPTGA